MAFRYAPVKVQVSKTILANDDQQMNAGSFGSFPVQENRPTQSFVDPNLLNARDIQDRSTDQFQRKHATVKRIKWNADCLVDGFQPMQGQMLSPNPGAGEPPTSFTEDRSSRCWADQINASIVAAPGQMNQINTTHNDGKDFSLRHELWLLTPSIGLTPVAKPEKVTKPRQKKDPNAPKKPKSRARKDQPKTSTSTSTTEIESDAEMEVLPEQKPPILLGDPPEDPVKHAEWDTVQAVWSPRNKPATADRIRNGIASYGELLKRLRNEWETQNEALKKAELNNSPTDDLRRRVTDSRRIVEHVMVTTLEWGHPSHIRKYVRTYPLVSPLACSGVFRGVKLSCVGIYVEMKCNHPRCLQCVFHSARQHRTRLERGKPPGGESSAWILA